VSRGPVVGWREWVGFPDIDVRWLKAKIDTGARTSSLHAECIKHVHRDGAEFAQFLLLPWQNSSADAVEVELPIVDQRDITSSNGETEERIVVTTTMRLGQSQFDIELTLTGRHNMGFRMLLGREAMRGRLLVDPAASYLQGRAPQSVRIKNRANESILNPRRDQ
jgi:hypothetical protein